ncbi:hypothetical protein [Pseudoalteromonas rubra]|uniref:Uncharacterized protein n=1 Tax=Pseudoalteromonas rubra TaxID=43658 RepID=A0A0U3I9G6_9GAMM|nr:hypothetical protein [Pseudoalteromonas rubra]ALU44687.1 hypothetical protein AT705_18110 [Pseudoalteromonas rubra]
MNHNNIYTALSGILLSMLALPTLAAGITELKVEGDIAVFKTSDAKAHTLPNCVATSHKPYWAISLTSDAGKAAYSSLITAISAKASVHVATKQGCLSGTTYEEAKSITITGLTVSANKVRFAGFVPSVPADFTRVYLNGQTQNQSPLSAMNRICRASFPGARAMLWDDFRALGDQYPENTDYVWVFDAIEHVSVAESRHDRGTYLRQQVIYKNGQIESSSDNIDMIQTCTQYQTTSRGFGTVLKNRDFQSYSCSNRASIACVY